MSGFKIGDTVRHLETGWEGEVADVDADGNPYVYWGEDFDGGGVWEDTRTAVRVDTALPMGEPVPFGGPLDRGYEVCVDDEGVKVYSECCMDIMSREVAEQLRDAITDYLYRTAGD